MNGLERAINGRYFTQSFFLEQRGSQIPGTRLPAATPARHVGGRGTPDREGALPVQRSLWSYGHLSLRSAKLDPRAP